MAIEVTAGAVVYRHGQDGIEYLLLQSTNKGNFWGFSKGHVEEGENLVEKARREIKEETSLQVEVDTSFSVYTEYDLPNGNHKEMTLYLADFDQAADLSLQAEEIQNAGWFNYQAARERLTYDNLKEPLDQVNAYLEEEE